MHGSADTAAGKGCGVELRSLAGFPVIEPQAGRELVAGHDISPHFSGPTNPKTAPWGSTAFSEYSPPGISLRAYGFPSRAQRPVSGHGSSSPHADSPVGLRIVTAFSRSAQPL